ncbi:MAG: competence/damage-inducible protein A [Gemmatimonadota bacterium]|nr:competence/damage-inducible protein A [Gemmatimonadota bacterium]
MDLELVTIGTELLLGHTIDTNAADLGRTLAALGARVQRRTAVADDATAIADAVRAALARSGFVITTGGLGPTRDDVTKRAVADVVGVGLETDTAYLERLEQRWRQLGRAGPMPAANRTQAQHPAGATLLPNPRGTAPGIWLESPAGTVVMLPGVPHEMRGLLVEQVAPRLAARAGRVDVTRSRVVRTTGVAESALADRLGSLEATLRPATLAYLPSFDGVDLRLTVWGRPAAEADAVLGQGVDLLRAATGEWCYGEEETDLAAVVLELAQAAGVRLAAAESCTGGLVAGRLTAVPGASATFVGGVVAYADAIKTAQLGVSDAILAAHGAVSEATVRAMATGVGARFGATATVAVSGIAGPTGGTPEKPVGQVWLAAMCADRVHAVCVGLPGDRHEIRARAAQAALDLLRRVLSASRDRPR